MNAHWQRRMKELTLLSMVTGTSIVMWLLTLTMVQEPSTACVYYAPSGEPILLYGLRCKLMKFKRALLR